MADKPTETTPKEPKEPKEPAAPEAPKAPETPKTPEPKEPAAAPVRPAPRPKSAEGKAKPAVLGQNEQSPSENLANARTEALRNHAAEEAANK